MYADIEKLGDWAKDNLEQELMARRSRGESLGEIQTGESPARYFRLGEDLLAELYIGPRLKMTILEDPFSREQFDLNPKDKDGFKKTKRALNTILGRGYLNRVIRNLDRAESLGESYYHQLIRDIGP